MAHIPEAGPEALGQRLDSRIGERAGIAEEGDYSEAADHSGNGR